MPWGIKESSSSFGCLESDGLSTFPEKSAPDLRETTVFIDDRQKVVARKRAFRRAWRLGPDDPALKRVAEILKKAAEDIDEAWRARTGDTTSGSTRE